MDGAGNLSRLDERDNEMSLDVYLSRRGSPVKHDGSGIYIRIDGQTREVSRDVWDQLYPGREPFVSIAEPDPDTVYSANITHNLGKMAANAGLYYPLWRPGELDITTAGQLIAPLRAGLAVLQSAPDRFREYNPGNGWGTYEGLVRFVADYLAACEAYPDAEVSVSR
jgi:hypothetical protein